MPQNLVEQLSREATKLPLLEKDWGHQPRWKGHQTRLLSYADVVRLRGSFSFERALARRGVQKNCGTCFTQKTTSIRFGCIDRAVKPCNK
jgi:isocitrate lyase